MNFYEAMNVARMWGDTVQFETGKITVTMGDIPRHGIIVSVPTLTVPGDKPRMAEVKKVWKVVQHYGADVSPKIKGAKLTLSHPTRGKSVVQTAPASLVIPDAPADGWTTLSPEVIERVQNATLCAATDEHAAWAMNGVRVTPSYVAATDGLVFAVVWCATGVTDPVTLPTAPVKRLPGGCDIEFAVNDTQGWFKAQGCTYWTALFAAPWPESVVNDLVPTRRETDSLTIDLPPDWVDAVKGAVLTDHDPDNPMRLEVSDTDLTLTIPNVYSRGWKLSGLESRDCVGFNAHLLMRAVKLLPSDVDGVYLSIASPLETLLIYTATAPQIEVLVAPCYLPVA